MHLSSSSFADGAEIPAEFALGVPDADTHVRFGANSNPALSWQDAPAGTRSFVLICVDVDAPSQADDVNQADRIVPADLPRADFYHWVMVDLPANLNHIGEGSCARNVVEGGKPNPHGPYGARQGLNSYTEWFAGDDTMQGEYFGYDGPCPPWNDSLIHHYHFRLFATDLDHCPVDGNFTAPDVLNAIDGHILAEAQLMGTYQLNPDAITR